MKVRYVFKLLAKHKVKLIQYTLLLSLILSSLLPWTGIYDLNPKPIMVIKTNSLGIIEALELIQNEAPTNYPIALTSIMLYTISIVTTTLYSIKLKKRKTGYISGILAITSSILWCRSTSPYAVAVLIDYVPGQEHGPHLIQYLPIMPDIAPILTLVTGIMLIAITKISKPIIS